MTEVDYFLGHADAEVARLLVQAAILRPTTERLLREAGLAPGMRVLDIGCGGGDVAMLAAAAVGPSGSITAIDRSADVIQTARSPARAAGADIDFREADLAAKPELGEFDLVIGRWVLVHQADPAGFIRAAAAYAAAGGIVAWQEPLLTGEVILANRAPLWHRVLTVLKEALAVAMPSSDVAGRLVECFHAAGLDGAQVFCEVTIDGSAQSLLYGWASRSIASFMPLLEKLGTASRIGIDPDTLERRFREEAAALHSQVMFVPQFCGWVRTP